MPVKKTDVEASFFSKINKDNSTGCWLWNGALRANGYGRFCVDRKHVYYAHRWSYEHNKGTIPEELTIDHLCHIRHCVNPDHLEAVAHETNMKRSKSATATHCARGHEYNEINTYRDSNGRRVCRTCANMQRRTRETHTPRQPKTHCIHGHPFDEGNTRYNIHGHRECLACKRIRSRERSQRANTGEFIRTRCKNGHLYDEKNTHYDYRGCHVCLICKQQRKTDIEGLPRTHCAYGHPFNEENTYHDPRGRRNCRVCKYMYNQVRLRKMKQEPPPKTHCLHGHLLDGANTGIYLSGKRKGKHYCRECQRITSRNRTLKRPRIVSKYTSTEWEELKAFYNHTCLCCGRKEPDIKLTADRVIPGNKGGSYFIENIQPLCKSCNFKKHTKIIDYRLTYTAVRQARFEHK